jgi:hypothetical protein
MKNLIIKEVSTSKDLQDFIKVPFSIYKDDPHWVAPLIIERKDHFSPKNPFFEHSKVQFFLALRDNKCVGRISAHIDYLYIEQHNQKCGFFGFIEAIDDMDVFRELFKTAEEWLKKEGMEYVIGPMNFSTNDDAGLLIEGFETPPSIMMGHAKPYYRQHIENLGYKKEKDLKCYIIDLEQEVPLFMQKIIDRTKHKIEIKQINKKDLYGTCQLLKDIFNDSWANNWGFIPFTEKEFYHIAKQLIYLIEDDFANIAYYEGKPVGMAVLLPNLNEIMKDLNGHLTPVGLFKILYRLKKRKYRLLRAVLLGVKKSFQKNIVASAIVSHLIVTLKNTCHKKGFRYLDVSWVLEDNTGIIDIVELGGGKLYKVYRVYGKSLT